MSKYIKNENCPVCGYKLLYDNSMYLTMLYNGTDPAYFGAYVHRYACKNIPQYNDTIIVLENTIITRYT